jgi:hypothetical protein
MSVDIVDRIQPLSPEVETDPVAPSQEELALALDIICRDSRVYPDGYLQETMVPHGGE